ncbi:MAG: hypothetical protein M3297_11355 [Thermoproteota archaeon]|jgi:hypothetical protein|nr:hypothetical protein [Thermoproteota archaeon]
MVTTIMFISFEAYASESNQSSVVSNLNPSSTAPADAIDMTVRDIATNNIDRLMSETILPVLPNSSNSQIAVNEINQTRGETVGGQGSINNISTFLDGQIKDMRVQNDGLSTNTGGRNISNSPKVFMMDPDQRSSSEGNAAAIADNGTILLQFQNPTDADIVNRLEKIEAIIQNYTTRNEINTTAKSIQESNNQIVDELSAIKSSISRSSILPTVTGLESTAKSIQESNNQIVDDLSLIKSSNVWTGIISGALAAVVVSAATVLALSRLYGDNRTKLSEMRLKR